MLSAQPSTRPTDKPAWMSLAQQVVDETDSTKLTDLVARLCAEIDAHRAGKGSNAPIAD